MAKAVSNPESRAGRIAWVECHQQALFVLKAQREGNAAKAAHHQAQFDVALQRYTRMTGYTLTLKSAAEGL
jgi:hypothetical protein